MPNIPFPPLPYTLVSDLATEIQNAALATAQSDSYLMDGGTGGIATLEIWYPQPGDLLPVFSKGVLPAVYFRAYDDAAGMAAAETIGLRYRLLVGCVVLGSVTRTAWADAIKHRGAAMMAMWSAVVNGMNTWLASGSPIISTGEDVWRTNGEPVQDDRYPNLFAATAEMPLTILYPMTT